MRTIEAISLYEPSPTSAALSRIYALYFAFYMLAWPFFREVGAAGFGSLLALAILPVMTARKMSIMKWATILAVLAIIYVGFSYARMLPPAWTIFYDASAIPQQAIGNITLPILIGANICFLREMEQMKERTRLTIYALFVVAEVFFTSALMFYSASTIDDGELSLPFLIQNNVFFSAEFVNTIIIGALIFRLPLLWGLLLIIVNLLLCTNFQPSLAFLIAIPCRLGWIGRPQAIAAAVGMFAVSVISTNFGTEILAFDPNAAIRTAFWKDAIASLWQAHGLGVGYGTEAIRGAYFFGGDERWVARETDDNFMFVGVHSSILQTLLRLGPLGFVLLILMLYRMVPAREDGSRFEYWIFLAMFLNLSVNVAIESVNFLPGVSLAMAVLATRFARVHSEESGTEAEGGQAEDPEEWAADEVAPAYHAGR